MGWSADGCLCARGKPLDTSLGVFCPQNTLRCPDGRRGVAGVSLLHASSAQPEQPASGRTCCCACLQGPAGGLSVGSDLRPGLRRSHLALTFLEQLQTCRSHSWLSWGALSIPEYQQARFQNRS